MTRAGRPDRTISRRHFLAGSGWAALGAVLAACGTPPGPSVTRPPGSAGTSPTPASPTPGPASLGPTGPLTFANWSGYIDLDAGGLRSPTIAAFEDAYAVEVDYAGGAVTDNEAFVAGIRPQLESNVEPGWDLVVLSDWMAARVVGAGWAERIDQAHVPTAAANLRDELRGRPWDAGNEFHYPWLSIGTGLAWNRARTGRDLARVADLFESTLAGHVTLPADAREALPLVHVMLRDQGRASDRSAEAMTLEDAEAAIEYLRPFVEGGHVRGFGGSEAVEELVDGRTWAALARSRDVAPAIDDAIGWAWPAEGSLLRTDVMLIPRAAQNRYTAELMIDWVYDPVRAATIVHAAGGISPVDRVVLPFLDLPDAPDRWSPAWPLIFPPSRLSPTWERQPAWDEETSRLIAERFAELTDG